jgi:hypothetical protein
MLTVLFIILGMFACSGVAIRCYKDLEERAPIAQLVWHCAEMVVLITFLSFLVVR